MGAASRGLPIRSESDDTSRELCRLPSSAISSDARLILAMSSQTMTQERCLMSHLDEPVAAHIPEVGVVGPLLVDNEPASVCTSSPPLSPADPT